MTKKRGLGLFFLSIFVALSEQPFLVLLYVYAAEHEYHECRYEQ